MSNPDDDLEYEPFDSITDNSGLRPGDTINPQSTTGNTSIVIPTIHASFGGDYLIDKSIYKQYSGITYNKSPQGDTEPSCEHQPIDVGFNRVKMVCKKCDKEL